MFTYTGFGLNIASALELPELLGGNGIADVSITLGDVPEQLDAPTGLGVYYQVNPHQFLLNIPNTVRYLVSDGARIEVERVPAVSDALVRVYLLGSAFGALLHQRGVLPLHGSAIATPRGAVVFAGRSGRGKSTLAWEMHRRGYAHLCDDVTVVGDRDGTLVVYPAFPQLNVWGDALAQGGRAESELRRLHPAAQKYAVPTRAAFHSEPLPLYALYELHTTNTNTIEITPLKGMAKLQVLTANTYRPRLVSAMGKRTDHFRLATLAGQTLRARTVVRPVTPFRLKDLADRIEQDFGA